MIPYEIDMKSLVLSFCCLVVLAFAFSACNNPVNAGYKYDYPVALQADTAYQSGELGVELRLTATVPNSCWEVDRVNLQWINDTLATVSTVVRHDISEVCPMSDTKIKFSYPVIAPYAHTYVFRVYADPTQSSYSTISVLKKAAN